MHFLEPLKNILVISSKKNVPVSVLKVQNHMRRHKSSINMIIILILDLGYLVLMCSVFALYVPVISGVRCYHLSTREPME